MVRDTKITASVGRLALKFVSYPHRVLKVIRNG